MLIPSNVIKSDPKLSSCFVYQAKITDTFCMSPFQCQHKELYYCQS